MRLTEPVRELKTLLGTDSWGGSDAGVRDILDPIDAAFDRHFPDYEPYPWGRRQHVFRLVRHILLAEPTAERFAALFQGVDPDTHWGARPCVRDAQHARAHGARRGAAGAPARGLPRQADQPLVGRGRAGPPPGWASTSPRASTPLARTAYLRHARGMRIGTPLSMLLLGLAVVGGGLLPSAPAAAASRHLIRVDQAGYVLGRPMTAWVLAPSATPRLRFAVVDRRGRTVLKGRTGASTGRWNPRYRGVLPIDLSGIERSGRFRVLLVGKPGVRSPWFRVGRPGRILDPLIAASVSFLGDQRDGTDLVGRTVTPAARHPSDTSAARYAWPEFVEGTEQPATDLVPLGSTTDVSGGWADAGDTIKLTHTTAYADALLWAAARELGDDAPDALLPEAEHGLAWLERMWHPDTGVLDLQVGIGSGAADGSFVGDHDVWRRPETDTLRFAPQQRYLLHRPVFQANLPGDPLPPNLAGRVAAAFALAAQVRARTDEAEARRLLDLAAGVFDGAKVGDVAATDVVTALPASWYPESSWRDDLAWAAAELALAGRRLDDTRTAEWLDSGILLAISHIENEGGADTLDIYDTGPLAFADLVRAIRDSRGRHARGQRGDAPRRAARGAGQAASRAGGDPFRAGVSLTESDAAPRAMGLVAVERLYRRLSGDDAFATLGAAQLDWVLGCESMGGVIHGGGRQHVAALHPSHDQQSRDRRRRRSGDAPRRARERPRRGVGVRRRPRRAARGDASLSPNGRDAHAPFTGQGSRFVDDVRAWQTVEPAIDMAATATLALALGR